MNFEMFITIFIGVIAAKVVHSIFEINKSVKNIEKKICECDFIPVEKKKTGDQHEIGIQLLKK